MPCILRYSVQISVSTLISWDYVQSLLTASLLWHDCSYKRLTVKTFCLLCVCSRKTSRFVEILMTPSTQLFNFLQVLFSTTYFRLKPAAENKTYWMSNSLCWQYHITTTICNRPKSWHKDSLQMFWKCSAVQIFGNDINKSKFDSKRN